MYSWVPSLLTWNYHNIFNRLYTNTKKSLKNRLYTNTKKSLKKLKSIFRKTSFCDFCLSLLENVEWETCEGVTHTTWPSTPWGSSWVGKTLLRELSSQMVKKNHLSVAFESTFCLVFPGSGIFTPAGCRQKAPSPSGSQPEHATEFETRIHPGAFLNWSTLISSLTEDVFQSSSQVA